MCLFINRCYKNLLNIHLFFVIKNKTLEKFKTFRGFIAFGTFLKKVNSYLFNEKCPVTSFCNPV